MNAMMVGQVTICSPMANCALLMLLQAWTLTRSNLMNLRLIQIIHCWDIHRRLALQVLPGSSQGNCNFYGSSCFTDCNYKCILVSVQLGDTILGLRDPNGNSSANVSKIVFQSKPEDENRTCSADLKSISKLQSRDQPGIHYTNMDTQIDFHSRINIDFSNFEESGRDLNEDVNVVPLYRSQSATGDKHCSRRSSSCNFDCIVNDNLNVTRTMHSGTDLEIGLSSSCLIQNAESSQIAENSCQLEFSSSSISKTKLQTCDKKKGKSTDIDALIQEAAASLISISLDSRTSSQTCPTESRSDEIQNIMREKPEYSSDSYESMVMNLTETCADDYCLSSNPVEVSELCNNDTGIKLRRGRRIKDFQKDILPGMASLSRHEIREDISIMEGVMRSREYKRLRSKTANIGNWFTPVRSRRSRLNYVGRKNYQW